MGFEDIIEVVLLLLFFIVAPLLRRYRQKQKQQQEPPPEPGEVPAPGQPPTEWPAPPTPAAVPDYSAYLVQSLRELAGQARRIVLAAEASPLLELTELVPVAEALVARTRTHANTVLAIAEEALDDSVPAASRALNLSRAIEEARRPLARARAAQSYLASLTEQRTNPGRLRVLKLLDRVIDALTSGAAMDAPRPRLAFLSDHDPRVITELVGAGPVGLVPVPGVDLRRAAGWTAVARGVGFDLLGRYEAVGADLREAAMFGPLQGKRAAPPFFATGTIDMPAAVGAWMHHLAADAVGAHLLGRAYALGLVLTATQRDLVPIDTATIATEGGRYLAEPPLLFRLTFIDSVLDSEGWTEAENGVGALRSRMTLPEEGRYVLPNGLTRRLQLPPILDYMRQLGQIVHGARLAATGDRRLLELVGSTLNATDTNRILIAEREFRREQQPTQQPLVLLSGAVLAEHEDEQGRSYLDPFLRAMVAPPRQRRRPAAFPISDRTLMRDALVLSEIL